MNSFFHKFQLISFNFNLQFLYQLKHMVHLSKAEYQILGFSILSPFYVTLYFCSTKSIDTLTLKCQISFQKKIIQKSQSFAARPLIVKFKQEVSEFNEICMSCSSPKTDLETNF